MKATAHPGVCRFCGNTEAVVDGNKFSWTGYDRTCCSRYSCVQKEHAEKRAKKTKPCSEFAGWGYGAVLQELRRRQRMRRKGKR